MTNRVVAWSTGNVGRHVLAGIDARPDLELVGLFVSNPAKAGKDAGELAGLGRPLGVAATGDAEALMALAPDCIVHSAMADDRLGEALADLEGFLRAGINVVSSGPVFLQYPEADDPMAAPLRAAAVDNGVSLWVNGVDPGFANDALPLVLTGVSERIDEVRCYEILNYATYNQPMVLFDIMGFAKPMDEIPMLLQPGVLTMAWGSVVRQIAAGLDAARRPGGGVVRAGGRPLRLRRGRRASARRNRGRAPLRGAGHAGGPAHRRLGARDPVARRPGPGLAAAGGSGLLPGDRHAVSRTTPSTFSCWGPTETTTRPDSRRRPCDW